MSSSVIAEVVRVLFQVVCIIIIFLITIPLLLGFINTASSSNPQYVIKQLKQICDKKSGGVHFNLNLDKYDLHFKKVGSYYKISLYRCGDYDFRRLDSSSYSAVRNISDCIKLKEIKCNISGVNIIYTKGIRPFKFEKYRLFHYWCYVYKVNKEGSVSYNNFSLGDFCYLSNCYIDHCYNSIKIQHSISGQIIYSLGQLNIKIYNVQ